MIMTWPYLRLLRLSYSLFGSSPTILMMFWISALFIVCWKLASRTFRGLPRRGKTPYLSRPTMLSPATANALALSPSVRISVHSSEPLPPAKLASSSFGIPRRRREREPVFIFFFMSMDSLALAHCNTVSTMPRFRTFLMAASDTSHFEPNFPGFSVKVSFVWESKVGFTTRQFTKTQRCERTWKGLMSMPPLFLAFAFFWMASTNWSATCITCVPPLIVLIEFAKDTCENWPSETAITYSQRSPHFS
mmetsp:Transcript_53055/g.137000  ORF Transcript_53055/g.137000 Transcript_53055/m.137000 type:complete len:248 (-) Transcript_53055:754-1497(-)